MSLPRSQRRSPRQPQPQQPRSARGARLSTPRTSRHAAPRCRFTRPVESELAVAPSVARQRLQETPVVCGQRRRAPLLQPVARHLRRVRPNAGGQRRQQHSLSRRGAAAHAAHRAHGMRSGARAGPRDEGNAQQLHRDRTGEEGARCDFFASPIARHATEGPSGTVLFDARRSSACIVVACVGQRCSRPRCSVRCRRDSPVTQARQRALQLHAACAAAWRGETCAGICACCTSVARLAALWAARPPGPGLRAAAGCCCRCKGRAGARGRRGGAGRAASAQAESALPNAWRDDGGRQA